MDQAVVKCMLWDLTRGGWKGLLWRFDGRLFRVGDWYRSVDGPLSCVVHLFRRTRDP
jgi:hypothetical protein